MRLLEFLDTLSLTDGNGDGTFVGAKLTKDSEKKLLHWMKENKISKPVPKKDLHVTVILDKTKEFNWPMAEFDPPLEVKADSYKIKKFGDDENTLVLTFSQPELEKRHEEGRDEYQIDWDFPSYQPHVTLSYDNSMDPKDILVPTFPLFIEKEYVEPFESDDEELSESILNEVTPHYRITKDMIRNAASDSAQFIVEMPPKDFLKLTMPESSHDEVASRTLSLLKYNRMAKSGDINMMPSLSILIRSERFGIVQGHEGRARALAMVTANLKMMPVAIQLRVDERSNYEIAVDRRNPDNRRLKMVNTKYKLNYDDLPGVIKGEFKGTDTVITKNWFLKVPDLMKHLLPADLNESLVLNEKIVTNREEVIAYARKWAKNISNRIPNVSHKFPNIEDWFAKNFAKEAMKSLYHFEIFKFHGRDEKGRIMLTHGTASGIDLLILDSEEKLFDKFPPVVARALLDGEEVESLNVDREQVIDTKELNMVADYMRHLFNNNPRMLEPHRLNRVTLSQMVSASVQWHDRLMKASGQDVSDELGMADYQTRELVQEFASGFGWYMLPTEACLRREGNVMGHCVGDYYLDTLEGNKVIVSLRSKDNKPHTTMSLSRNKSDGAFKIEEIKGKANDVPHQKYRKYIDAFIAKFTESTEEEPFMVDFPDSVILEDQKNMNSDLLELGYISLPKKILRLPEGSEYLSQLKVDVNTNDPEAERDLVSALDTLPSMCWYVARLGRSFVYGSTDNPDDILYEVLTKGYFRKEYKNRGYLEDENDSFVELKIEEKNHNFIEVL